MKKLEFEVVIYQIPSIEESDEIERLKDLGIYSSDNEEEKKEKLVRYSFKPEAIIEYRESIVKYRNKDHEGVVCLYNAGRYNYETPVLLISYDEFERKIEQYYACD